MIDIFCLFLAYIGIGSFFAESYWNEYQGFPYGSYVDINWPMFLLSLFFWPCVLIFFILILCVYCFFLICSGIRAFYIYVRKVITGIQ